MTSRLLDMCCATILICDKLWMIFYIKIVFSMKIKKIHQLTDNNRLQEILINEDISCGFAIQSNQHKTFVHLFQPFLLLLKSSHCLICYIEKKGSICRKRMSKQVQEGLGQVSCFLIVHFNDYRQTIRDIPTCTNTSISDKLHVCIHSNIVLKLLVQ